MNFVQSVIILALSIATTTTTAFTINAHSKSNLRSTKLHSFVADSSDYKSSDSDYSSDDQKSSEFGAPVSGGSENESPTFEESPVPMSKNAGNRFLAFVFDKTLTDGGDDADIMELHEERIELTEDHVLFCRKANLYNETFNTESMADVLWSNQL